MSNTMEYKGYVGSVEFSQEDSVLFGKVMGIRALISYEGQTVQELVNDFHDAVDAYLNLCAEEGTPPEKAAFPPNSIAAPPSMQRRTKPRSTALLKARSSIMFPLIDICPAYFPRLRPNYRRRCFL